MPAGHIKLGRAGEDAAVAYLKAEGYRIVERNWTGKQFELDIIARKDEALVFVEVKTRKADSLASPEDGLTLSKERSLVRGAALYLSRNNLWHMPCRFDLCAVYQLEDGSLHVTHIPNAFDHTQALGLPDGWQPW